MWTRIGSIFFIALLLTAPVGAQDISFNAVVSSNKVSPSDVVQLTLTITGTKGDFSPLELGAIDGFDVRYVGPSTSISFINGAYSREKSFIYNLLPLKTGHFQIPSFSTTINNQKYTTQPIDIDV